MLPSSRTVLFLTYFKCAPRSSFAFVFRGILLVLKSILKMTFNAMCVNIFPHKCSICRIMCVCVASFFVKASEINLTWCFLFFLLL